MKKYFLLSGIFLLPLLLTAQSSVLQKPVVKTERVYTNKKLSGITVNDEKGRMVFSKTDGLSGPLCSIGVMEYDSSNRVVRTFFAHSNFGFSLSETGYFPDKNIKYNYIVDSAIFRPCDCEFLNKIRDQNAFLNLPAIKDFKRGKRVMIGIETLDSHQNVIADYYIAETGDTSSCNTYEYNENNKETCFHYNTIDKQTMSWDIYSIYDKHSNVVKTYRVSAGEAVVKDTTEVYEYQYNQANQLVSDSYYNNRRFGNRTEYFYNDKGQLIKKLFYEGEETVLDAMTQCKYDKYGNVVEEIIDDFRNYKSDRREIRVYSYSFW